MNTIQDVPQKGRDQSQDKRAGGHFSVPENSTVTSTESNLHMCLRNKKTRARTRVLEVTSQSLNKVTSTESNLHMCLRNTEARARTRELKVTLPSLKTVQ
jgi:hypothetical protein